MKCNDMLVAEHFMLRTDFTKRVILRFSRNYLSYTANKRMTDDALIIGVGETSDVRAWKEHIDCACEVLKRHKLIAVPTDTIYGIAGLAQSTTAVQNIYNVKARDLSKPIAICVSDIRDIKRWGKVNVSEELLSKLLPGPVTVVFERTPALNPDLNRGTTLVGIRIPDYSFIRDLARSCNEPLALTSANISNGLSPVNIQEFCDLWPKLDKVFDGGTLGTSAYSRLGSTVVDLSRTGYYTIIRPGSAYKKTVCRLKAFGLKEDAKS